MYQIYSALMTLAAPLAALALRASRKHRPLLARFRRPVSPRQERPLWVHACSVGEVKTALPILAAANRRWPELPIVLSVSTVAGWELATRSADHCEVAWFPFDVPIIVQRFMRTVNARLLVLIETELWPAVMHNARRRGLPVVIVNGRLSDKHFRRYLRWRSVTEFMFETLSGAGMQSEIYAERIARLGAAAEIIQVTGNTKFDGADTQSGVELARSLQDELQFAAEDSTVVFGSTRPGDEDLAAACWKILCGEYPSLRFVIAPRHLDRVQEAVAPFDEEVALRSDPGQPAKEARILVVDTLGELEAFYGLATIAVIGGSFFPGVEGHNPLESAARGIPTVFGPHMGNFIEPARLLVESNGAFRLSSPTELCGALRILLADKSKRNEMGRRGREVVLDNQGAINRSLDMVARHLDEL